MKKRRAVLGREAKKELTFGQGVIWNSAGSLVYLGCNWLITVLVVVMSPDYTNSGHLAIAMAIGNIFSSILLYKMRPVQVSDVDDEFSSGNYVSFKIVCCALAVLFCFGYSYFTASSDAYLVIAVYLLFKTAESFVDVYHGIDQRANRFDYIGVSQLLRGILIIILFPLGFYFTGSLIVAVCLMAVSSFLVVLVYDVPRARKISPIKPEWDTERILKLFSICTPGFLASLIATSVVSIVRQMYGLEYGSELLGIYAAVATPSVVVQAVATYIYLPLLGPLSIAWKEGDTERIRSLVMKFFLGLITVCAVVMLIFILFGEWLLGFVYGGEIASYGYLLAPIVVCTGSTAAMFFLLDLLIVLRDFKGALLCNLVSLVLAVLFMNYFFEIQGMNGINLTITASYAVGIAASLFCVFLNLRKRSDGC